MRIAVFDYFIVPTNPIGSCHLRMLQGLNGEHDFVVFAARFANPAPDRIRFVRIPVPPRPLALLFVAYHLVAPIAYLFYRLRGGRRFDMIQTVESNCWLRADVVYAHFCHRRFLNVHWPAVKGRGLRAALRWLDHVVHSIMEPVVYRRAGRIVVPSGGLARDLADVYPRTVEKTKVLPNPVDLERMKRPGNFDRAAFRSDRGFTDADIVLLFVALGHFERKGLPLILEAMKTSLPPSVKLIVVGGTADLIEVYRQKVSEAGLSERVHFAGMQSDVRPYFWSADIFVLPSIYEVFPLVALEAAASALPVIAAPLHGVEEFLVDGENGFLIERSASGVTFGIQRFLDLDDDTRRKIGERAQQDVGRYSVDAFQERWRACYRDNGAEVK
jgi:glycosyltransferase involved in cell wall biosynthesis